MKGLLLAAAVALTASTAAADQGVPIVDGMVDAMPVYDQTVAEAPGILKPVVVLGLPFFWAFGILTDTADKIAGN
jgi:predicted outer membrane lipoprotein